MPTFNAQTAECLVFTYKEGLLSPIAHDLKMRVGAFDIEVDDSASPKISACFDAMSFSVVNAMKDGVELPGELTANDRRKIEDETRKAVLKAKKFRDIRFESRAVTSRGEGFRVEGDLTLVGKRRRIDFIARRYDSSWLVEVDVHQPDFGIKPFKALLGTLKIKPTVRVRIEIPADQISIP